MGQREARRETARREQSTVSFTTCLLTLQSDRHAVSLRALNAFFETTAPSDPTGWAQSAREGGDRDPVTYRRVRMIFEAADDDNEMAELQARTVDTHGASRVRAMMIRKN